MSECPFCEILAGRAPATIVREWPDAVALVPLNPVVPGHLLVLPRVHVAGFFSNPEVSAATMRRVAEMVHGVELHHDPHDYNVITSAGVAATQTVFHLHVHLVPREMNDGLCLPWTPAPHLGELRAVAHASWHLMDDSGEMETTDDNGRRDYQHLGLDHEELSAALDALEATGWDPLPEVVEP